MTIRGTCGTCGKGYRLPSAGRTYPCKSCGGEVSVADEVEPEPEPEVHRHAGHGSVMQHREAIDARHRAEGRKKLLISSLFVLAAIIGVVGFRLLRP